MNKLIVCILFFITMGVKAQNKEYDKMLEGMYEYTVPLIKHDKLHAWMKEEKVYILDARESNEYKVSHIQNAIGVGYDNFNLKSVQNIPKDAKVIVYCSVGYRK